jgi:probable phosphoglycerate mutase
MTTRLFLIRHGATVLSVEDSFAGATDVELSEAGRRQVEYLANRLATEKLVAIYTSPLRRTMETAAIVGLEHGLTPIPQEDLREIHHGHWEAMRRTDVEAQFPQEYAAWEADPFTFAPEGGECGASVIARALPVIRQIVLRHAGECMAVVSHKATIRLLISSLLGFDARGYRDRLDQLPACLNILDFKDPTRARLILFNDVSHYAGQPPRSSGRLSKWWDPADSARQEVGLHGLVRPRSQLAYAESLPGEANLR